MEWYVYVIRSGVDGRLYKGMTQNIESRVELHNRGKVSSTKAYVPWRLVYTEICKDSLSAREREKYLKSSKGRDFLRGRLL
jgi:putative endonuclease